MFRPFSREIKLALLDLNHFMGFMNRGTLFVSEEKMAKAAYSVRSFAKALITCEKTFLSIIDDPSGSADNLVEDEKADARGGGALALPRTPDPRGVDAKLEEKSIDESSELRLQNCIQLLIELNNSLQQQDAARGILEFAKQAHYVHEEDVPAKWNELLGDWNGALKVSIIRVESNVYF
jgi:hypothetical protein